MLELRTTEAGVGTTAAVRGIAVCGFDRAGSLIRRVKTAVASPGSSSVIW